MRNSVFSLSPRRAITGKHKAEAAIRLFSEPRTERTGFSPDAPRVLNMFDLAVNRPEGPSHISPGWSAFCGTLGNRDVWNGPALKGVTDCTVETCLALSGLLSFWPLTQGSAQSAPPWANMSRPFRPPDPYSTVSLRARL